jgi:hypothetical protein
MREIPTDPDELIDMLDERQIVDNVTGSSLSVLDESIDTIRSLDATLKRYLNNLRPSERRLLMRLHEGR